MPIDSEQHILCTIGDCNGIGAEVLIRALYAFQQTDARTMRCRWSVITHPTTWQEYMNQCGLSAVANACQFDIIPCTTYSPVEPGCESLSAGLLAGEALHRSADILLSAHADAVVTMPVSKYVLQRAGYDIPGQTELFGTRAGIAEPMMILTAQSVRVALATIHVPLSVVPTLMTRDRLLQRCRQLHQSLHHDFGCLHPRIAMLGVNPHAGEHGAIGTEESIILEPTIAEARSEGMNVSGPFPADGFFAKKKYNDFDGVLAMYHDQGLIPVKMLAGGHGVNFTAGLPFVRTSPDHGTAFDIAGAGIADYSATLEAMRTALHVVDQRLYSAAFR
jgi:4-hydroxythreonine-4-phosphate dehydrogenase